jgi:hypothetical protein
LNMESLRLHPSSLTIASQRIGIFPHPCNLTTEQQFGYSSRCPRLLFPVE